MNILSEAECFRRPRTASFWVLDSGGMCSVHGGVPSSASGRLLVISDGYGLL